MDRQGFIDFNTRLSPENSGKADSYARAIRILDEVLPHQDVIDLHGKSLYDVLDIDILEEVWDLVKEEVKKMKEGKPIRNSTSLQSIYPTASSWRITGRRCS